MLCSVCKERPAFSKEKCQRCYMRIWHRRHPEYYRAWKEQNLKAVHAAQKRHYDKGKVDPTLVPWERRMRFQTRSKVRKARANLSLDFLRELRENSPVCRCCGVPLDYTRGRGNPTGASLDRVIPTLGYEPSNVAVVCTKCNLKNKIIPLKIF